MERFLDAGRKSLAAGNTMAALFVAIGLPDICGSLISPTVGNGQRYRDFAAAWIKKLIPDLITAAELYALRNSLFHAGSDEINKAEIARFVLMDRPRGLPVIRQLGTVDGVNIPGSIIINAPLLCSEIFEGVDAWSASEEGRKILETSRGALVRLETESFEIHRFLFVT